MSAEDLTTLAGVSVQQDLALVSLLGLAHVERNGHHFIDGMSFVPQGEQAAFAKAHPDLYSQAGGPARLPSTKASLRSARSPARALRWRPTWTLRPCGRCRPPKGRIAPAHPEKAA